MNTSRPYPLRLRRFRGAFLATLLALCLLGPSQEAKAATEYEIKAVYLLMFAKSIGWTEAMFADAQAPLVVGVLGNDPFGTVLNNAFRGETVGRSKRPLVVIRARNAAALPQCHIVFVSKSEERQALNIVARFRGKPTLVIGDFSPFSAKGGHLNFILSGGAVKYEFNASAIQKNGLKLPSKIQRSGTPVSES